MTRSLLSRLLSPTRLDRPNMKSSRVRARRRTLAITKEACAMDASRNRSMHPRVAPAGWEDIRFLSRLDFTDLTEMRVVRLALLHPNLDDFGIAQLAVSLCIPLRVWFDDIALAILDSEDRYLDLFKDEALDEPYRLASLALPPLCSTWSSDWPDQCVSWCLGIRTLLQISGQVYSHLLAGFVESRVIQEFAPGRWPAVLALGPSKTFLAYSRGTGDSSGNGGRASDFRPEALRNLLGRVPGEGTEPDRFLLPSNDMWAASGRHLLGAWSALDETWFQARLHDLEEAAAEGLTADEWVAELEIGPDLRGQYIAAASSLAALAGPGPFTTLLSELGMTTRITTGFALDHLAACG
jgi:hypothetical protein